MPSFRSDVHYINGLRSKKYELKLSPEDRVQRVQARLQKSRAPRLVAGEVTPPIPLVWDPRETGTQQRREAVEVQCLRERAEIEPVPGRFPARPARTGEQAVVQAGAHLQVGIAEPVEGPAPFLNSSVTVRYPLWNMGASGLASSTSNFEIRSLSVSRFTGSSGLTYPSVRVSNRKLGGPVPYRYGWNSHRRNGSGTWKGL